jgi:hypothetical protein
MAILKSTNLNLRISPEVREALREAADREHRSISNMVEYLIVQYCKQNNIVIGSKETSEKANL